MILSAILGLTVHAPQRQINFSHPFLPAFIPNLDIRRLEIGDTRLDVALRGRSNDVDVQVTRDKGTVEALLNK